MFDFRKLTYALTLTILLCGCSLQNIHDKLDHVSHFTNKEIVMAAELSQGAYCGDKDVNECFSLFKSFAYAGQHYNLLIFRKNILLNENTLKVSENNNVNDKYVSILAKAQYKDGNLVGASENPNNTLQFTLTGNVQVLVFTNADKNLPIIIAIRGTDNIANLIQDLTVRQVEFLNVKNAMVNLGMYNQFKDILISNNVRNEKENFTQVIDTYVKQKRKFILVGHSLGASSTVLMSAYLITHDKVDKNLISIINFAEPFPGNKGFSEIYSSKFNIERYVWFRNYMPKTQSTLLGLRSGDPVVAATMAIGNKSFGTEYKISDLTSRPNNCSRICMILSLHSINNYSDFIEKNLKLAQAQMG